MRSKKAQGGPMGISFGMIVSIIMIIFIIVASFIVINMFLGQKDCSLQGMFYNDFQSDVQDAWNSEYYTKKVSYTLPDKTEYVCFVNFSDSFVSNNFPTKDAYLEISRGKFDEENLYLYPDVCNLGSIKINHIKFISPTCFEVVNGKVEINLKKERRNPLVNIYEE